MLNSLKEHLTGFIETKIELLKLEMEEKVASLVAAILIFTFIGLFTGFAVLFLSISLSIALNLYLDSLYLGYLIIGGVYILIVLSLILFIDFKSLAKKVKENINNRISSDEY